MKIKSFLVMALIFNQAYILAEVAMVPLAGQEVEASYFEVVKNTAKNYISSVTLSSAIKDAALAYAILLGTVIVHEYTHALLVQFLYGVPCDTFIGMANADFPHPPKYTGMLHIVSWKPFMAQYFHEPVQQEPLKELAIAISGPMMAMLANYLCFKGINDSTEMHEYPFSKITSLAGIVGHGAQFVPYAIPVYGTPSDGARTLSALYEIINGK